MAPPDQGKLSPSCSLSSSHAAVSPSSSYASALPASAKLSYDSLPSIAGAELAALSSFSSVSSYESFFHIDAPGHDDRFLDFDPATRPPLVQTAMHRAGGAGAAAPAPPYDPKRLPASMFRTKSTSPAEWSVNSNESLFSIQLSSSHSGELYSDLYYDAAGVPRFPSLKLPSLSEASMASGGLCMRDDCTRCTGGDGVRKSVRFAAKADTASGEVKHSPVYASSSSYDGRRRAGGVAGVGNDEGGGGGGGGRVVRVRVLLGGAAGDVVASLLRVAKLLRLPMLTTVAAAPMI
ncbi:hypothetical protein ACP4OV_016335 [Aristida adscensionis]